ncbi:MAG: hypothetical protein EXS36_12200 [Pedosphaera sp.]|nr:hypothetical protein [Pedosphaera sp.]
MAAQGVVTAIAAGNDFNLALVIPTAPAITTQPVSRTSDAGQSANFTVVATGGYLNYQWRKDGTNLNGATNATYNLVDVQTRQAGNYTVVVSNFLGSVTSPPPAVLTVIATAPTGTISPVGVVPPVLAGSPVYLCRSHGDHLSGGGGAGPGWFGGGALFPDYWWPYSELSVAVQRGQSTETNRGLPLPQ